MSRIGRLPIAIPAGVTVTVDDTNLVTVKGPKGEESYRANSAMQITVEDGTVKVARPNDNKENRALHGLTRTLIANMIFGVSTGFSKTLVIEGVGYRAKKDGKKLVMNLGYSHEVVMPEIDGITIDVPNANTIVINGYDKQKVGQFAAEVREKRPPEPYKGKGIRYNGEHIIRKEGKAGKGKK